MDTSLVLDFIVESEQGNNGFHKNITIKHFNGKLKKAFERHRNKIKISYQTPPLDVLSIIFLLIRSSLVKT